VGCKTHFFVTKHEKHKYKAKDVANALLVAGYSVWLSQPEQEAGRPVDAEGM